MSRDDLLQATGTVEKILGGGRYKIVLEAGQVWRVGARGEPVEVKILIQAPDNGTEPE